MGQWSQDINALAKKTGRDLETVVKKVTFDIFNSIILKSPVDTGRFRSNWNVSAVTPDFTTTLETSRGSSEAAKAFSFDVGGVLYISNGLPYARRLEYGYSKQAPYGMVRYTLLEYRRYLLKALYE